MIARKVWNEEAMLADPAAAAPRPVVAAPSPPPHPRALADADDRDLVPAGWYPWCKRGVDVGLALTLLVVASPVMLLTALLVRLSSRGPAVYKQVRLGLNGRPFTIYKFRSMTHDCEKATGARWSTGRSDPRVTRVGRFIRTTHLDELPQLVNVLKGEMSLVGPRPERPEFIPALEAAVPNYRKRLLVRPGLTGLAQVNLPPDSDVESVRKKVVYDLHYVRNLGLLLDLRLIASTALKVISVPTEIGNAFFGVPRRDEVEGVAVDASPVLLAPEVVGRTNMQLT